MTAKNNLLHTCLCQIQETWFNFLNDRLFQLGFHISFLGYDAMYFDRLGFDMDVLSLCWKVPQDRQLFIISQKIKAVL
jgi:hypothetical protein